MQTFAPSPDLEFCAETLDTKRLGKQIIECRQIGKAIADPGYGWQNHPAVKMWRKHSAGLLVYATYMNAEWESRRGKTHGAYLNMLRDYGVTYAEAQRASLQTDLLPDWWGDDRLHRSHQSNLIRKDHDHYAHYFTCRNDLNYWWPV